MALRVDTPFMTPAKADVQQHEFNEAYADNNKGRYIIVDYNGRYELTPQMIEMIKEHRPKYTGTYMYVYGHGSVIYPTIVSIFIDIMTGKIASDDEILHNVTLIWVDQDTYDSGSWIYEADGRDDCDQSYTGIGGNILYLDDAKLELFRLKRQHAQETTQLYYLFETMTTLLQTTADPLPSLVGLFNPLVITEGIDIHAQVKEANELASLLPGFGSEYENARDRFNA